MNSIENKLTLAFAHYKAFVISNAAKISSLENSLRSFSYFLPGRFKDADFSSEILFAGVNLLTFVNDSILAKELVCEPPLEIVSVFFKNKLPQFSSSINVYSRSAIYGENGKVYRKLAYTLMLLKIIEVVAEMTTRRLYGNKARWKLVLGIEFLKAALKLTLLKKSQRKMLLGQLFPERPLPEELNLLYSVKDDKQVAKLGQVWISKRSNKVYPTIESVLETSGSLKKGASPQSAGGFDMEALLGLDEKDPVRRLISDKALKEELTEPSLWVPRLSGLELLGEILYICRPLAYVLAIIKYKETSWKPWMLSVLLDIGSIGLSAIDTTQFIRTLLTAVNGEQRFLLPKLRALALFFYSKVNKTRAEELATKYSSSSALPRKSIFHIMLFKRSLTALQKDEFKRRLWQLLWYFLREPLYSQFTKKHLDRFCQSASKRPIISLFASVIRDYQPLWEQVYFVKS